MQELNRIVPAVGPEVYKTYQIARPLGEAFWRIAACEEVDCPAQRGGWRTVVDERTDLGQRQAHYIRHDRTRHAAEERLPDGTTAFTFGPGQRCFKRHRVPVEREPFYAVRSGDWRGDPSRTPIFLHKSGENWVDDFANHQDRIITVKNRG